ncbi:MAG TPA: metallophosphoesterase [Phycisphaerae bacterium]|jgi:hypothetical protein
MKPLVRNVQLGRRHGGDPQTLHRRLLERLLIAHPILNRAMALGAQVTLTLLIWPRFFAPYRWQLTRHPLRLAGLHPAFNGYRILQLTDLHVGKCRPDYLMRVIEASLAEKPNLTVITGDLIDYHPDALKLLPPILKKIMDLSRQAQASDGVVAIFGNHDYHEYSWRHVGPRAAHRAIHKRLVRIVEDAGIKLLRNQQHPIRRHNGQIVLVGLDEMWTGRADPTAAFNGLTPQDAVICLQHNPDGIEFLRDFPWQFMICGHSHGGQALFPLLGALYVPMQHRQYLRGFFDFPHGHAGNEKRTMFVSRGIGHSTPIRLRCRPEVTLFTLDSTN